MIGEFYQDKNEIRDILVQVGKIKESDLVNALKNRSLQEKD